jgi:hypothetical protein
MRLSKVYDQFASARVAERRMKYLILFLAIMCGMLSVALFVAADSAASGGYFAGQICTVAGILCEKPLSLALAAAALMALWIMLAATSSFGN